MLPFAPNLSDGCYYNQRVPTCQHFFRKKLNIFFVTRKPLQLLDFFNQFTRFKVINSITKLTSYLNWLAFSLNILKLFSFDTCDCISHSFTTAVALILYRSAFQYLRIKTNENKVYKILCGIVLQKRCNRTCVKNTLFQLDSDFFRRIRKKLDKISTGRFYGIISVYKNTQSAS